METGLHCSTSPEISGIPIASTTLLSKINPFGETPVFGQVPFTKKGEKDFDKLFGKFVFGSKLADTCILFSLETSQWACRIQTFGQVIQVLGTKRTSIYVPIPAINAKPYEICHDWADSNESHLQLSGTDAHEPQWHCASLDSNWSLRDWDGTTSFHEPLLFDQAIDEYTADIMESVSNEILQVEAKFLHLYPTIDLDLVHSIRDFFEEAYADDIADHSCLQQMFLTNKVYNGLQMPTEKTPLGGYLPLFDHRYLNEDLPCGILVQKGIAQLVGVPTPAMDEVIQWCRDKCHGGGKEYFANSKAKTLLPPRSHNDMALPI